MKRFSFLFFLLQDFFFKKKFVFFFGTNRKTKKREKTALLVFFCRAWKACLHLYLSRILCVHGLVNIVMLADVVDFKRMENHGKRQLCPTRTRQDEATMFLNKALLQDIVLQRRITINHLHT
jgi:hypothetical protein